MNLNKVILIGRIGSDIRYFQTQQGIPYVRATLVINRRTTSNNEAADYIPILAWRTTADFINMYMRKGDLVSVEGTIQSSQYTDKNQQIVRSIDVVIDSINNLETRQIREARREKSGQSYSQNNSFNSANNNMRSFSQETKPSFGQKQNFNNAAKNQNEDDGWTSVDEIVNSSPLRGFNLPDDEDDIE